MKSEAEQRDAFVAVRDKQQPFTKEDLQVLRETSGVAGGIGGHLTVRMQVELIDAIQNLNATSSFLAKVGISVAVVGVILTITQIVLKYF